jgi:hypothetical protein
MRYDTFERETLIRAGKLSGVVPKNPSGRNTGFSQDLGNIDTAAATIGGLPWFATRHRHFAGVPTRLTH